MVGEITSTQIPVEFARIVRDRAEHNS
ncbi:MAG: hypothetical protein RLZZ458_3232, partial [Planctomycetota bacterium]